MLFCVGFLATFLLGGLTGVLLAAPSLDFHVPRHLFRGGALPLRAVRHDRVRHLCRHLLLVPEDDRPDAGRTVGQTALLDHVHRFSHSRSWCSTGSAPKACPAGTPTTCPPTGSPPLNTVSTIGSYVLGASVLPFIYNVFKSYRYGEVVDRGRPVGLRQLPGVGHVLPAAAAQLQLATPHPLRTPGVRPALSTHGRTHAHRARRTCVVAPGIRRVVATRSAGSASAVPTPAPRSVADCAVRRVARPGRTW